MTYEQLLELSEKLGSVNKGFSKEDILLIPYVRVSALETVKITQR
jgi:hypothetical protein